jgi:hypothetical protein
LSSKKAYYLGSPNLLTFFPPLIILSMLYLLHFPALYLLSALTLREERVYRNLDPTSQKTHSIYSSDLLNPLPPSLPPSISNRSKQCRWDLSVTSGGTYIKICTFCCKFLHAVAELHGDISKVAKFGHYLKLNETL